jgi:hypothetical protein
MQDCIVSTGAVPDPTAVEERILPSRTLTAIERLDIYRGMYELRLEGALRIDYPGLLHFLGEERFTELSRLYIREHPSRSYTLNRLGDRLPDFLPQVEGLRHAGFLRDLARFELAETLVFDEQGPEVPAAVEIHERMRLKPIPALRLLTLDYPAQRYLKERSPTVPRRRKTFVVVYRKGHAVHHLTLTSDARALFEALCSGAAIGEALEESPLGERAVFGCFRDWFGEGLFLPRPAP